MLFSDSGDSELATREIAGDLAESRGRQGQKRKYCKTRGPVIHELATREIAGDSRGTFAGDPVNQGQ